MTSAWIEAKSLCWQTSKILCIHHPSGFINTLSRDDEEDQGTPGLLTSEILWKYILPLWLEKHKIANNRGPRYPKSLMDMEPLMNWLIERSFTEGPYAPVKSSGHTFPTLKTLRGYSVCQEHYKWSFTAFVHGHFQSIIEFSQTNRE